MRIVLDTNVIVSAFLNANGVPARIMAQVLNGGVTILYDNRILFEYADVLSRKKLGFDARSVRDVIDYVKYAGEYVNAGHLNTAFSDESDKKFYEVFTFGQARYLVTGNTKHFPKDNAIITPREFITAVNI